MSALAPKADISQARSECPLTARSGPQLSQTNATALAENGLLFDPRNGADIGDPGLSGAKPQLQFWHKLVALTDSAQTDGVDFSSFSNRSRIDWRSAIGAECLWARNAAFNRLDVDFQFA